MSTTDSFMSCHQEDLPQETSTRNKEKQLHALTDPLVNLLRSHADFLHSSEENTGSDIKFTVSFGPPQGSPKMPADLTNSMSFHNSALESASKWMIYNSPPQGDNEDVSEEFVMKYNRQIGNTENQSIAPKKIAKMRRLGGLEQPQEGEIIDVPSARMGLCILAGLDNFEFKNQALASLLELLQNDPLSKESAGHLVSLTIRLMRQMNRDLMQTETVDVQIKIAQIYSILAELIQRHYGLKHINAITKELKTQLTKTAHAIRALNRQENTPLSFHINCALEGIRRLTDDKKELYDILQRFYHLISAAGGTFGNDMYFVYDQIIDTFKDLDPHLENAWYNGILILHDLAKTAHYDEQKLRGIQSLVNKKFQAFNWKFSYEAMNIFCCLSLSGSTEKIRLSAFEGIKNLGTDVPGLATFAAIDCLKSYPDFKPMTHLKKPVMKDPNVLIRQRCAELLMKIVAHSKDEKMVYKAKKILERRYHEEKDPSIRTFLNEHCSIFIDSIR